MSDIHHVLLDRDGVIIVNRENYTRSPGDVALLPGAAAAIARLNRAGLPVVVITNQSVVGRGIITAADLDAIHRHLDDLLVREGAAIDAYHICPHHPDAGCACRKPRPGLLFQARDTGVDLDTAVFIGDTAGDADAARAAGCRFIGVGATEDWARRGDAHAADLGGAVAMILDGDPVSG